MHGPLATLHLQLPRASPRAPPPGPPRSPTSVPPGLPLGPSSGHPQVPLGLPPRPPRQPCQDSAPDGRWQLSPSPCTCLPVPRAPTPLCLHPRSLQTVLLRQDSPGFRAPTCQSSAPGLRGSSCLPRQQVACVDKPPAPPGSILPVRPQRCGSPRRVSASSPRAPALHWPPRPAAGICDTPSCMRRRGRLPSQVLQLPLQRTPVSKNHGHFPPVP